MFLRRYERRKSGKPHTYRALVESYRTANGPRQRVVAYLGALTADEQDSWAKLGAHHLDVCVPSGIRKAIYTVNAIESINSVIRKFTRNRK